MHLNIDLNIGCASYQSTSAMYSKKSGKLTFSQGQKNDE
jgi:hypothetical protein